MKSHNREVPLTQAEINYRRSERLVGVFTRFTFVFSTLLIIGFILYWVFHKTKNQKLFYKHFVVQTLEPIQEKTETDMLFNQAVFLYKEKKYEEAIKIWDKLLLKNPKNDTLHYYTGLTYLAFDKENPAIFHLNKVLINNNSIYLQDAYYYLGLANLKADNPLVAAKYLSFVENRSIKNIQSKIKF